MNNDLNDFESSVLRRHVVVSDIERPDQQHRVVALLERQLIDSIGFLYVQPDVDADLLLPQLIDMAQDHRQSLVVIDDYGDETVQHILSAKQRGAGVIIRASEDGLAALSQAVHELVYDISQAIDFVDAPIISESPNILGRPFLIVGAVDNLPLPFVFERTRGAVLSQLRTLNIGMVFLERSDQAEVLAGIRDRVGVWIR